MMRKMTILLVALLVCVSAGAWAADPTLVAKWTFDTINTAVDAGLTADAGTGIPSSNHITNDMLTTTGPTGLIYDYNFHNGIQFDGVNDYISIPNCAAFNFGSGDFAISFWIKGYSPSLQVNAATALPGIARGAAIIVKGYNGGTDNTLKKYMRVHFQDSQIFMRLRDGGTAATPSYLSVYGFANELKTEPRIIRCGTAVTQPNASNLGSIFDDNWHHIVLVRESLNPADALSTRVMICYRDGDRLTSVTTPHYGDQNGNTDNTEDLRLGNWWWTSGVAPGSPQGTANSDWSYLGPSLCMDDLRIYKGIVTQDFVRAIYPLPAGPPAAARRWELYE